MTGVRTELVFERAEGCPVAAASADVPGPVTDINWTNTEDGTVTEQVTVTGETDVEEFEQVFDYGARTVYEFDRGKTDPCVCEHIQTELGPVTDVHARGGDLHVTIHAGDVNGLRDLIMDLRERFGDVSVEYLVRSVETSEDTELVPVDVRKLTDRQREVLSTAHEMGYFEYPREANASEVADRLDIQPSTFAEHLAAAQGKLMEELLDV